jgi:hypothetical protein
LNKYVKFDDRKYATTSKGETDQYIVIQLKIAAVQEISAYVVVSEFNMHHYVLPR